MKGTEREKRGPEPERVKVNKPWAQAIKDALQKKRPKGGWPKRDRGKARND